MLSSATPDTRVVILTDNLLEAVDLTEQMEQLYAFRVAIFRSPRDFVEALVALDVKPALVIFGIDPGTPEAAQALEVTFRLGCPVLLVDCDDERIIGPRVAGLIRPFSSRDVETALNRLEVTV